MLNRGVVKEKRRGVGSGPFPSELDNEISRYIRQKGNEYGTTTGRPRRCGWFDAMAVKYTAKIGGINEIAMMHLDTLAGIDELKICTGYTSDGKDIRMFPSNIDTLARVQCRYETLEGFKEEITQTKNLNYLPIHAKKYIKSVEEILGLQITFIGIGTGRNQTIFKKCE